MEKLQPKLRFPEFEDEWLLNKLNKVSKIYDGTHQTPNYVENGIPFYSVEHVSANQFENTKFISEEVFEKENKRVKIEKGDILMTRIGSIGVSKYIDWEVKASFYVSLALIKVNNRNESKFINQVISSPFFQSELWKKTIHVAFPQKINLGEIGECRVILPKKEEQTKIANFLSAVDKKINQLTEKKNLLEDYKKGIMQKIFSQELRFKDDDGNDFPEWVEKKLGSVIDICSSKRVLQEDWTSCGVPFLRTREIISLANKESFRTPIYISEEMYLNLKKKYGVPVANDLLVTGVGTIGEVYLVDNSENFYFKDGNVLWFKMNNKINSMFLLQLFKTTYIKKQLSNDASITTVATFTIEGAKKTNIFYPCLEEQTKIANFLSAIDDKINQVNTQLEATKEFKKGLLQQMFV